MPTNHTTLLDVATSIAQQAGELALRRRGEGVTVAGSKSSIDDIVTLADRETEDLIRSLLAEARPDDGILGEERDSVAGTSGLTWVVDPIDGTVNYLYGIRQYAVSIAVVEGDPDPASWSALAGVVFNPAMDECFSAELGRGATLNGAPIHAAAPVALTQALIGTGFAYLAQRRVEQAKVLMGLISHIRDIRHSGSSALGLCDVAAGRLNGYFFERGLQPWDFAAGALIAAEAGARVSGLGGAPASGDFILAADPGLAEQLERVLVACGV